MYRIWHYGLNRRRPPKKGAHHARTSVTQPEATAGPAAGGSVGDTSDVDGCSGAGAEARSDSVSGICTSISFRGIVSRLLLALKKRELAARASELAELAKPSSTSGAVGSPAMRSSMSPPSVPTAGEATRRVYASHLLAISPSSRIHPIDSNWCRHSPLTLC